MKQLKIFNSLSGEKEIFEPYDKSHVKMYVCGPTVYSNPHLGNARAIVVYDLLFRILKTLYSQVTYARNITDVDDKINQAAIKQKMTIFELTGNVTKQFHDDVKKLRNLPPTYEPCATDHITDIIEMIQKLIDNGNAYISGGHVLFSVKTYEKYGELSGRDLDDLIAGSRVEVASFKKDPEDFVLWKPAKESDDVSSIFESPWGKGRPGWHIECSVMSTKLLGENFDIHGGGADLKFPHHENEIAQSRCAYPNSNYAKYWVHNGFLTVNGEKMSKSLGNFITIRELLENGISGRVLRYILLATHYRKPLDYNMKILNDARKTLHKFDEIIAQCDVKKLASHPLPEKFQEFLLDDLNFSKALAYMHDLGKEINNNHEENDLLDLAKMLEFLSLNKDEVEQIPESILNYVAQIEEFRAAKKYAKADELRDKVIALGYNIKYTKEGKIFVSKSL